MSCLSVYINRFSQVCKAFVSLATPKAKVNVSIVCTASTAEGDEMWWCSGWRVLWNNGVKALWVNNDNL